MKYWSLLLTFSFLVGCSTNTYVLEKDITSSPLSRSVSSEQIDELSALGRLETIEKHIQATYDSLPQKGNPRFYIFENFKEQVHQIIESIKDSYPSQMEEQVFIPKDRAIAKKYLQIISAHKAMSHAGIFVNFNQFSPEDPKNVTENLTNLDRSMNHYYKSLKNIQETSNIIKVEDFEKAESDQNLALLQYLARRIEAYYEDFSPKYYQKRNIRSFLKKIRNFSSNKRAPLSKQLHNFRNYKYYKRVMKYANSLTMPESSTVDGAADSYEKVLSFQFGIELIDFLATNKFN